ncbi:hypothetical protein STRCR_0104 [Streptococcus criceti HS-6]|uniref:Uncharacterized protein n=1 Tax=Streptococcus criceti HS-6 TaxID=873449 RepID=G5JN67_STRCG|nr:hypothetical protein STRCR_0104 [Streptococcus criceti HS-6]
MPYLHSQAVCGLFPNLILIFYGYRFQRNILKPFLSLNPVPNLIISLLLW